MNDIGVLICSSEPRIERESVLLVETLRRWGGGLADVPVYSFQVRPARSTPLRRSTRRRFAELGVHHIEAPLNKRLPNFGWGNKIYAASWAEATLTHSQLVFLDSDMLVLAEPSEFAPRDEAGVAVTPEPFKVAGTDGADENASMWEAYENHVGLDAPRRFVETQVEGQRIRAYYNSGCVAVERRLGLFALWREITESLVASDLVPPDSRAVFTEQISLTLAMEKLGIEPRCFSPGYNYQIAWHSLLPAHQRAASLDEIVVAHYHRRLDTPTTRNPLRLIEGLPPSERDDELGAMIREAGVTPDPRRAPVRSARVMTRARVVPIAKRLGMRRGRYAELVLPR
jgi:hypothetical protein